MTARSGILLAGGQSRRFPPNKLLETVDGEPLFWRALRALAASCDEVIVLIGASQSDPALPPLAIPARVVRDRAAEGPLAAIAEALASIRHEVAIVLAGDAPDTPPSLLRAMGEALVASGAGAVALREGTAVRPLPVALRPRRAATIARGLVDRGIRRLGVLVEYGELATDVREEDWWRRYDEEGAWRRDVDEPGDLGRRSRNG